MRLTRWEISGEAFLVVEFHRPPHYPEDLAQSFGFGGAISIGAARVYSLLAS